MATKRGKRNRMEQIVKKLWDANAMLNGGEAIGEVCQVLEVSEPTFHRRQRYGGMKLEEAQRSKELGQENVRLKKLVANVALDIDMLKEIVKGNSWAFHGSGRRFTGSLAAIA